ncbi:hypothetical protein [Paraburkholderia tropica]|uniref:hypothetical protein n=1 Tax=Paraburkholderia tropica TaxID=92647 RepID=UPI000F552AC4|nr:hypothetical protein [Paraburkholderia tropica]QNB15214.1 hypothetical protein G5S35_26730 [Paraburkholderia tropica]RQN39606.1 hypothetical protein EHZ25_06615 [Paraburkholderia tropica]
MSVPKRVRRIVVVGVSIVVAFIVVQYIFDARERAKANDCYSVTSPSGRYRAEACETGANGNVVSFVGRLYELHSGALLARTDFDSMDGSLPVFMPDESAVMFRRGGDDASGTVAIPPNWRDKLRAKLP